MAAYCAGKRTTVPDSAMQPRVRRLLIVSPRFPPRNAPDHHRIRASLPYYRRFGWEPTVLCVSSATSDSLDDPWLAASVPADVRVVPVPAWDEGQCRRFGFGHLDYRCLGPLYAAGVKLLKQAEFEVVFFSTTVFPSFLLGPLWKRRFACRVVYDFQDPWFHGGALLYTRETVPGKWWKYRVGQMLARRGESLTLRAADHIISVSDGYVSTLSTRYPWLDRSKFTVLPFGVAQEDFDFVRRQNIRHEVFAPDRDRVRWVYAGRIGPDMYPVLDVLFRQLAALKRAQPELAQRLDVFFVGTNYSPAHRSFKVVEPLARHHGVADMVIEHSERIPYFQVLSLYCESDGILLIGSHSSDYTASKFFNCVLARRPLVALFHADSLVSRIASSFSNVCVSSFQSDPSEPAFSETVARGLRWLATSSFDASTIEQQLASWSAEQFTRAQCAIFDRLLDGEAFDAASSCRTL